MSKVQPHSPSVNIVRVVSSGSHDNSSSNKSSKEDNNINKSVTNVAAADHDRFEPHGKLASIVP